MSLVNVQLKVENNYSEDLVVESQTALDGTVTDGLSSQIMSGGGRSDFKAYAKSNGGGVKGLIGFRYPSQGESFVLSFQYGGSYDATSNVEPTKIQNVDAILSSQADGLTYIISLNFIDPKPQ